MADLMPAIVFFAAAFPVVDAGVFLTVLAALFFGAASFFAFEAAVDFFRVVLFLAAVFDAFFPVDFFWLFSLSDVFAGITIYLYEG